MDLSGFSITDLVNMTPYELGRNFFIPFILVFVIFWAILERLNIFGKKIRAIISISLSVILVTTPAFSILSVYITQLGATTGVVIFAILFIGGSLIWALSRGRNIYNRSIGYDKRLMKLEKEKIDIINKIAKERDPAKINALNKQLERIKRDITIMEARRNRDVYR